MPKSTTTQVVITANASVAEKVMTSLKTKADELKKAMSLCNQATAEGVKAFRQLQQEFNAYNSVIRESVTNTERVDKVMADLSNTKLKDLRRALGAAKKALGEFTENNNVPGMKKMQDNIKALQNQIKLLEGEFVNIKKHMGELPRMTDAWLNKAIQQQQQMLMKTREGTAAYQQQEAQLKRLNAEQTRRAVATINSGTATASQLTAARGVVANAKNNISVAKPQDIATMNNVLLSADKQLDTFKVKAQEAGISWQRMRQVMREPLKSNGNDIKATMEALQQRMAQLPAGSRYVEILRAKFKELDNVLKGTKNDVVDVNAVLKNIKSAPLEQLKAAAKQLETELNAMARGTKAFTDKQADLAKLRNEMNGIAGAATKAGGAFATTMRNLSAYFGLFTVISKSIQTFEKFFTLNNKLSDALTDIRKVSGLTTDEVSRLSNSLNKIDTRSSVEELNKLAYAGAKLGMGQYGVGGMRQFVSAANQVNVALKEDLGDEALTQLSKITEVMGLIPRMGVEQAMLKTGSAIFKLSNSSTATSGHIVEFSKRLLSMARSCSLTTADLLGLGSAADSMALMPEVASTALGKFMVQLQRSPGAIEKALSIPKGTIFDLLQQGKGMDAILTVLHAMKEQKNVLGMKDLFKDLGSNGQRLITAMTSMAKNVDMVEKHVKTANEAFTDGTAITQEYTMQQETAQAYMERASNLWEKSFVNSEQVDVVKSLAQAWYDVSKELTGSISFMVTAKLVLGSILVAIKTLLTFLPTIIMALSTAGIAGAVMKLNALWEAGSLSLTGLIGKFKALSAVQQAMGWGALVGVLASIVIYLGQWTASLNKLEAGQRAVNDVLDGARKKLLQQEQTLNALRNVAKDETASLELRQKAIAKLNSIIPEYNGHLDKTKNKYIENTKALGEYLNKLTKMYELEGAREKLSEIGRRKVEAMLDLEKKEQAYASTNNDVITTPQTSGGAMMPSQAQGAIGQSGQKQAAKMARDAAQKRLDDINAEENAILKRWGKEMAIPDFTEPSGGGNGGGNGGGRIDNPDDEARNHIAEFLAMIKEYYTRQKTAALEEMTKNGVEKDLQDLAVSDIDQRMQIALSAARESIVKENDTWRKFRTSMNKDLLEKDDENGYNRSKDLLTHFLGTDAVTFGKELDVVLAKIKHSKKEGDKIIGYKPEDSDELLRARLMNQTAQSENKNATADMRRQEAMRKDLLEHNYTGVVQDKSFLDMAKDGFAMVNPMATEETKAAGTTSQTFAEQKQQIIDMLEKSRAEMVKVIESNGNKEDILKLLFGEDYKTKLKGSSLEPLLNANEKEFQLFYAKLIQYSDEYTEAEKKAYQEHKKNVEFLWKQSGGEANQSDRSKALSEYNSMYGEKVNYGSTMGFSYNAYDPELASYRLKMEAAREYYDFVKTHTNDVLLQREAEQAALQAQDAYTQQMVARMKTRLERLKEFMQPTEAAIESIGEAWAEFRTSTEDGQKAMINALKTFIKQYGTMLISNLRKVAEQSITRKVTSNIIDRQAEIQPSKAGEKRKGNKTADVVEDVMPTAVKAAGEFIPASNVPGTNVNAKRVGGSGEEYTPDKLPKQSVEKSGENTSVAVEEQETVIPEDKKNPDIFDASNLDDGTFDATDPVAAQNAIDDALLAEAQSYHAKMLEEEKWYQDAIQKLKDDPSANLDEMMQQHEQETAAMEQQESEKQDIKSQGYAALRKVAQKGGNQLLSLLSGQNKKEKKDVEETSEDETETRKEGFADVGGLATEAQSVITSATIQGSQQRQSAEQAETSSHKASLMEQVVGEVVCGIAGGGAKTVEELGWWGIPLVAVISAALMALLNWALGSIGGDSDTDSSAAATNTKLVSGMLTYDEGNVGQYVGTDGKVYTARDAGALPGGVSMVSSPIATTVNGQPSLVAENGPEIVVGRETTAAMMQNAPQLLSMLAAFDKTHTLASLGLGNGRMALFDDGNLTADAAASAAGSVTAGASGGSDNTALMQQLLYYLQNPVAPNINMYGRDGLHSKIQQANQFMNGK